MKLKHLLFQSFIVCGLWCAPLSTQADSYPTTSYTLSADGTTLVKWMGEESVIDMTADPAFDQVTTIGEEAFAFNGTFTSVKLSQNVTIIEKSAFNMATTLETIYLPESLLSIGEKAFRKCNGLKSVDLPSGLTSIGSFAFENCENLEDITLPSSVNSLGFWAFGDCSNLKSAVLSPNLTDWSDNTFSYCANLTAVILPDGLTYIPASTFQCCYALEEIILPYTMKRIGKNAFADTYHDYDNIKKVTCRSLTPPEVSGVWSGRQNNAELYVPVNSISEYKNHAEWGMFGSINAFESRWFLVTDADEKFEMSQVGMLVAADESEVFSVLDLEGNILTENVRYVKFEEQYSEATKIESIKIDRHDNFLKSLVNNRLTLVGAKGEVELFDLSGMKLRSMIATGQETVIDVATLPTGVYIVRCGKQAFKFNKK